MTLPMPLTVRYNLEIDAELTEVPTSSQGHVISNFLIRKKGAFFEKQY